MEYYLTIERNKQLTHVTTWVNFKNLKLKEKKTDANDCILYDSIYEKSPEMASL